MDGSARLLVCLLVAGLIFGSHALVVEVTEQMIAWFPQKTSTACFSVLDYSQTETRTGLPLLLRSIEYRLQFREAYRSQNLTSERARDLLDAFLQHPSLHPFVLPFELVAMSNDLMRVLLEDSKDAPEYNPGRVLLPLFEWVMPDAWRSRVLEMINLDPMLYYGKSEIEPGLRAEIWCPWRAFVPQALKEPLDHWAREFFLIDMWLHSISAAPSEEKVLQHLKTAISTKIPFEDSLLRLAESLDLSALPIVLDSIDRLTEQASETIRSMWHGKVLLALMQKAYAETDLVMDKSSELCRIFVEFLAAYDLAMVPTFILKGLAVEMMSLGLHLPVTTERHLYSKLLFLDMVVELKRGIWGGLDRYLHAWRVRCEMVRPDISDPVIFASRNELIEWWAGTHCAEKVLSPNFPIAVTLLGPDGRGTRFAEPLALLADITSAIASDGCAFERDAAGRLSINRDTIAAVPEHFWVALTRTIAYNLFFFGDPRISLAPEIWDTIYGSTTVVLEVPSREPQYPEQTLFWHFSQWCLQVSIPQELLVGSILTAIAD